MAITIIVTNAGRAALVNAANTGTNAVTVTELGITAAVFVPDAAQVALPGEIKRIALASGVVVADDQIHVTASDVTTDAYAMRGFGLYLADGTLFAIYGQPTEILNKTSESMMLLAADIAFADIDAEMIEFGDTNFILPPATTEILGLVELATTAEAQAGSDAARVLTPLTGKQSVLGWLLSQDGSGSGLDADMLDGYHASAFSQAGHTHGSMAEQNANNVNITGGAIEAVTLTNIGGSVGIGCAALPSTKLQVRIGVDRRFSVFANGADNVFGFLTDAGNWADTFLNGSLLRFGIGGTERARIDASGFFGINQPAPAARIHVRSAGEIMRLETDTARGGGGNYLRFTDPSGTKGFLGFTGANETFDVYNALNGSIQFVTNGAARMRVEADGRITINGAGANYQLNTAVANPSRGIIAEFSNNAVAGLNGAQISFTQNGIANWCIGQVPGLSAFGFFRDRNGAADGTEVFRIAANGDFSSIGSATIGNGTGTQTLTIATSRAHFAIVADGAVASAGTTINYSWATGGQGPLKFSNSAGEVMRLGGNSFVGIGTGADAAYLLEVATPAAGGGALQTAMQIKSKSDAANNAVEMRFAPLIAGQSRTAIGARREGAAASAALFFATGGAERLTLDGTGHLVPGSDGQQILGWPTARFKEGHFSDFVRVGGNNAWHAGNDGSGSGLDADMLDGLNSSAFLQLANFIGSEILSRLVTVDGSGSGLDADLLDGYHASSFDRVVDQNLTDDGGYIVYASGRKECWGRVVAGMDSYATWNLPIAHTSWCHPSFTYTGKIGVNNTGDNTMFAGFLGAPPYALRFWNAEDQTLTIYVRTIGV